MEGVREEGREGRREEGREGGREGRKAECLGHGMRYVRLGPRGGREGGREDGPFCPAVASPVSEEERRRRRRKWRRNQ